VDFGQGVVDRHNGVQVRNVNEGVAQRARHARVDLGDHQARRFGRRLGDAHFHPKGTKTMVIGRGHLDQGHIERQPARGKQGGDLGQAARRKVGAAGVDGRAHVVADEERVDAQVAIQFGCHVIGIADREHLNDLHTGEGRGAGHQRAQHLLGHGTVAAQEDAHVRLDQCGRLLGSTHAVMVGIE
jgi:hypothetical protein